jgi:L-ascorbate metabolism protein UlaG (beta-lactamase superfamily)
MDAKEAAELVNTIKPKLAIPMHWGSIVGSSEDADNFSKLCKCKVEIKKPI